MNEQEVRELIADLVRRGFKVNEVAMLKVLLKK
jgi:hypothetical protein